MKVALITTDSREPLRDYANPAPSFGTAPQALLEGFAALPGIEVHVVSCAQQPMQSPEKLADNLWFHSLLVPKIGWLRTGYQGCIRAVRKKLRQIQPAIVHGQGTERDCALSAVFSGFHNVLTIHGNMRLIAEVNRARPFSFVWLAARLESFTIPRSQGVVCISHYTRAAVGRLAKQTWVVSNAADDRFFEVNWEPPSDVPPVILCVANVGLRKNQNAFIRALDPLAAKRAFKLVFVGCVSAGEAYGREFLELVSGRRWCEYVGHLEPEALRRQLSQASMLALPSLEDNCPMAVLEAAASGVPVVAARVGGVPELIAAGETGLLFDPHDAASMSGAVQRLLEQPEFARTLAGEANRRARERYHPRVVARRHLEIYQEILGQVK